ncbi:DUF397 domain-containing protein [Streptomyces sp. NPDC000348]
MRDAAALPPAPGRGRRQCSVHVRDSRTPDGPRLTLTAAAWARSVTRHAG